MNDKSTQKFSLRDILVRYIIGKEKKYIFEYIFGGILVLLFILVATILGRVFKLIDKANELKNDAAKSNSPNKDKTAFELRYLFKEDENYNYLRGLLTSLVIPCCSVLTYYNIANL
jgi:hypothetical protein